MKIGVRVPPAPPSPRLAGLIERLVTGGVDSLWWGDHLMAYSSPSLWEGSSATPSELALHTYSDPFVVMAWCANIIGEDTMVGTCVTDAVRRMPATLAQTALTLDHIVRGKVVLGLGSGEIANYQPYGWDVPSPAARFEDATRRIRSLLDDPGPDPDGGILALRPPAGSPGPELWLAAHGPRGLRLTGELADGWLPVSMDAEEWLVGRKEICRAADSVGRDPAAISMGISLDVVLQDTHDEAAELLQHPAIRQLCLMQSPAVFARYGVPHPLGGRAFSTLVPTLDGLGLLAAARAIPDRLVSDCVIHGTVEEVALTIKKYEGLSHLRLSDLSGAVRPGGGGTDRLLALAQALR